MDPIAALDARRAETAAMRQTLQHLVHCCNGDARPDGPIFDGLAQSPPVFP